jgi:hypothetical protein
MKTAFNRQVPENNGKGSKMLNVRTKASSHKRRKNLYPRIDELLVRYPLTTRNEFGDLVIRGRRIC